MKRTLFTASYAVTIEADGAWLYLNEDKSRSGLLGGLCHCLRGTDTIFCSEQDKEHPTYTE